MRVYQSFDVAIDPSQGIVSRSGEPVLLRARSFHVLVYLIEHRERLVPKEELLQEIWKGTAVTDSTLVGCIQEIRRALDDRAKSPKFIRTALRLGYQFVGPVTEATPVKGPPADGPGPPAPDVVRVPAGPELSETVSLELAETAGPGRLSVWSVGFTGVAVLGAVWLIAISNGPLARGQSATDEVVWWRFDADAGGKVKDAGVHHLEGSPHPSVQWEPGVMGKAIRLDGLAGVVDGSGPARLFPAPDAPRTFLAWIRATSTNGDDTVVVNETSGPNPQTSFDNFQLILRPDGRALWTAHRLSNASGVTSVRRVDDGQWHQLAGSYRGAPQRQAILYIDGREEAAGDIRLEPTAAGREVRFSIGNSVHRWTPFRGSIDDVRIFGRALRPSEITAAYRCVADKHDVSIEGQGDYYLFPLIDIPGERPRLAVEYGDTGTDGMFSNAGLDFAGVQAARRSGECAASQLRGADVGQDLIMTVDLLTPTDSQGRETQAGPYFRSRSAAPGDGVQGGTSAGYWVRLHSNGTVTVRRLNPPATIAFTAPATGFDPGVFHTLAITVRGDNLEAKLDSKTLVFDQAGRISPLVSIPAVWREPLVGYNQGAAGVLFSSEGNRNLIGGQRARGLKIAAAR